MASPTIDLARLFNGLTTLMRLRPENGKGPTLSMVVQPTLDVTELLVNSFFDTTTVDVSAGSARVYIVPLGRRARIGLLTKPVTVGATGFYVLNSPVGASPVISYDSAGSQQNILGFFWLNQTDEVRLRQGNAADTAIACGIMVTEYFYPGMIREAPTS
jgi:hypothetical protein